MSAIKEILIPLAIGAAVGIAHYVGRRAGYRWGLLHGALRPCAKLVEASDIKPGITVAEFLDWLKDDSDKSLEEFLADKQERGFK